MIRGHGQGRGMRAVSEGGWWPATGNEAAADETQLGLAVQVAAELDSRLDRAVDRLFSATRLRYLHVLLALTFLSIQLFCVPAFVTLYTPLWRSGWHAYPHALWTFELVMLLGGTPGLFWMGLRHHRDLVRYLRGDSSVHPERVYETSVSQLPRAVTEIVVWYVLFFLGTQVYLHQGWTASQQILSFVSVLFSLLGIGVFYYLFFELALRPVVRELAPGLPQSYWRLNPAPPLSRKLLVLLPLLCLFNGATVGSVSSGSLSFTRQLAVVAGASVAVSALMAGVVVVMLQHSLVAPLNELRRALRDIARGGREVRLRPLGAQELDEVAAAFNDMAEHLDESESELRASRARVVTSADAARRQVERDLHDGAQQRLVLMGLKIGLAQRRVTHDPDVTAGLLDELHGDLDRALAELRDLAHGIYPAVLENEGLLAALREAARSAGIPTSVDCDGIDRHRPELEAAVYFCCLEALQNAAKHAGELARVDVRLRDDDHQLRFEIRDNGTGFDLAVPTSSSGLQNMADRIGALGGELHINSTPGVGTSVTGVIPTSD